MDSLQHSLKRAKIDRFRKMHVEAGVMAAILVSGSEVRAHRDCHHVRMTAAGFGDEIVTVTVGQPDVAQHNIDGIGVEKLQAAGDRFTGADMMTPAP